MKWTIDSARLTALLGSLALCTMLVGVPVAGHAATEAAAGSVKYGTVWRIRGDVTATKPGTAPRKLREGDLVYVGEKLQSGTEGEAVVRTDDAGVVAVRPNTEFVALRFAAEDKANDGFVVRLVTGSLRLISGWIGQTNRGGSSIVTASATIGIRGTDHEPYVPSKDLAQATENPEGTYDKVNRGGTELKVGDNKVDINPGQVGFARAAPKNKERALLTLLLPVLLDKVPSFYVPGEFDAELDRYSAGADQEARRLLEQKRKGGAAECEPAEIAKKWLAELDGAILRGDSTAVIDMFADNVKVKANIKEKGGKMVSVDLTRNELAQSTITAIKGLKDYRHRRIWTDARLADLGGAAACDGISLRSAVVEQGKQSGKPYRFESVEHYDLSKRNGKWLATKAETTQQ